MKNQALYFLAAFGLGASALAADVYSVNVNRVMGNLSCTVTGLKSDHPEFDCTLKVKGSKNFALEMKQVEKGYYGLDSYLEGNTQKHFTVIADEKKAIKGTSFADVSKVSGEEVVISVSGGSCGAVNAVSLNPLRIQTNPARTEVKVNATFAAYNQDKTAVLYMEQGIVPDELMNQLRPQVYHFLSK